MKIAESYLDYSVEEKDLNHHVGGEYGRNQKLIMEFAESGHRYAEIKNYPHKDPKVCVTSYYGSIKDCNMPHIKITRRNDRVFLINTLIE